MFLSSDKVIIKNLKISLNIIINYLISYLFRIISPSLINNVSEHTKL